MQLIPSLRHKLELGPRANGLPRYKWKDGMPFLPDLAGGVYFPQVYCRSMSSNIDGEVCFTDDVIFKSPPSPLLRLVVSVNNMAEARAAQSELESLDLEAISQGELKLGQACFLVHDPLLKPPTDLAAISASQIYRIATGEEFANSRLCINRAEPVGYDMYQIQVGLQGRRYVLVRPDRFVFAACWSGKDLTEACGKIESLLLGRCG
jgi:hypothetical protein